MERMTGDVVQYQGKSEHYSGIRTGELVLLTHTGLTTSVQSIRHGGAHLAVKPEELSLPVGFGMMSPTMRTLASQRRQALYVDLCTRASWQSVPDAIRAQLSAEADDLASRYSVSPR